MSAHDEAERLYPILSDVPIARRQAFVAGAEWAVEETPERIEAMARAIDAEAFESTNYVGHQKQARVQARAALAALRVEVQR